MRRSPGVTLAPDDPKVICLRLDELAKSAPATAETVRRVEVLLQHRREGVQVKAAQTLARWGRPSSKMPLRELLLRTLARRNGSSVRKQVADALAPFIDAQDAPWVIDLYFSVGGRSPALGAALQLNALLPLLCALPPSAVVERVRLEADSPEVNHRRAALIAAQAIGDREIVQRFIADASDQLRMTASNFLGPRGTNRTP
jgi:hypothetical protein